MSLINLKYNVMNDAISNFLFLVGFIHIYEVIYFGFYFNMLVYSNNNSSRRRRIS